MSITSSLARSGDPDSSHAAGRAVSSFATQHYAEIVRILEEHPQSTAGEIASHGYLSMVQVSRRMKELEKRGVIERVKFRTCTVGGRMATTWQLAAKS
jgi:predicted ArsR family transcriptional regulator